MHAKQHIFTYQSDWLVKSQHKIKLLAYTESVRLLLAGSCRHKEYLKTKDITEVFLRSFSYDIIDRRVSHDYKMNASKHLWLFLKLK